MTSAGSGSVGDWTAPEPPARAAKSGTRTRNASVVLRMLPFSTAGDHGQVAGAATRFLLMFIFAVTVKRCFFRVVVNGGPTR